MNDPNVAGTESTGSTTAAPPTPRTYKPLWQNTITLIGLYLAGLTFVLLATFILFSIVAPTGNPYLDVVGYLILPIALFLSVLMVPFGILFKSWRIRRKDPTFRLAFRLPQIDLTDERQRRVIKAFLITSFVTLPIVGVSAYQGYHYTDSSEFCGYACHSVMRPQAVTYEISAHARVSCAECHIGPGASWFVKSKLSGTRQVFATLSESYSRPIPPAIRHLRPARETCEQCHWPRKFFGAQLREIPHFASDEANTRRDVVMLVKTGGSDEVTGRAEGIHLHMALANRIEFIATDDRLQEIPWVRMKLDTGEVLVYRSDGRPTSDPAPEGEMRQLDCMDCHNRPAHKFRSPQEGVNLLLSSGMIDTTLPYIKREAVRVLAQSYPDADTARARIGTELITFYREQYPDIWEKRRASVNQAVDAVRRLYDQSFFPEMRVDWRTYPDNIGHMYYAGCFRCHDGKHINQYGDPISHACNVCHTFLNRSTAQNGPGALVEGPFLHPIELTGPHATLRCNQCHDGGPMPEATCAGCHADVTAFRAGTLEPFVDLGIQPEPMFDTVDCESCHDPSQPADLNAINATCTECHDEEEGYGDMLGKWQADINALMRKVEAEGGPEDIERLRRLRRAGPLHNPDAAKAILNALLSKPTHAPEPQTPKTAAP